MAKDLNKVQIIGRLGKDPETRYLENGTAICKVTVATSREWVDRDTGEKRQDTEWFNVVAWNKLGEICAQYLQKGARVYFEGYLKTRSWEDQQTGQRRYMTELIAQDLIMLGERQHAGQAEDADVEPEQDDDPLDFNQSREGSPDQSPARRGPTLPRDRQSTPTLARQAAQPTGNAPAPASKDSPFRRVAAQRPAVRDDDLPV